MFRKLRAQLTAVCAAVTGLVLVGMAGASFSLAAGQMQIQFQEHFQSTIHSVLYVLRAQPVIDNAWLLDTEAKEGVLIRVQSREYQMLLTGKNPLRQEVTAMALATAVTDYAFDPGVSLTGRKQPEPLLFRLDMDSVQYRVAAAHVPTDNGVMTVVVAKNMAGEREQLWGLLWRYVLCVAVAMACLTGFAWLFTGRAIRPVEESRRKQNEFVSAASHELRSPLAVIQVGAEGIQDATLESARQYGQIIQREVAGLSRLTDDLLRLAGADSGGWQMELHPVNPEAMVLSAVERYEAVAQGKGIRLEADLPGKALPRLQCDRQRMEQALAILLDNAVRFTPENERIIVGAKERKGGVVLWVADSGPGVPADKRRLVFDRFYQVDAARTDREHYGLGLSVAREIAELHKGEIMVAESELGGAEFILVLPAR